MVGRLEGDNFSQDISVEEKPLGLTEARERLIKVLSTTQVGKPRLTRELAEAINQDVGRYLGDRIKVRDLILPSKSAGGYRKSLQTQGFEGYERVDKRIRRVYNSCMVLFARGYYIDLGEIRDAEPEKLRNLRNIGKVRLDFVKAAFARPQAEKQ